MNWYVSGLLDRIEKAVGVKTASLSELLPCPYNREIDKDKVQSIKDAVTQTGTIKPFVCAHVNTDDGKKLMITDGHHRHLALKELAAEGKIPSDARVPYVVSGDRGPDSAKSVLAQRIETAKDMILTPFDETSPKGSKTNPSPKVAVTTRLGRIGTGDNAQDAWLNAR